MNLSGTFQLDISQAAGQRFAVIGKSGAGKSNTLGVFAEEWMAAGLPLTVVDPMHQFGLLPGAVKVGRRKDADLTMHTGNAVDLAKLSVNERVSVLLDMSLYKEAESLDVLDRYLTALWDTMFEQDHPQPYALVIDEAQLFAPQSGKTILSDLIIDLAKRGRHKNLTTVIATQRAASIVKDFLTQATLLIAHRLTFGVDTTILREQLPLPEKELNGMMRKLSTGEALVLGDPGLIGEADYRRVQIRKRLYADDVEPVAVTPGTVRHLDDNIKKVLAALAKKPPVTQPPDHEAALKQQLADAQNEIKRLETALQQAQTIKITMPDKIDVNHMKVASVNGVFLQKPQEMPNTVHQIAAHPEPIEVTQVDETEPYRSERSLKIAQNKQRRRFDRLKSDFATVYPYQRAVLMYLYDREGEVVSISQLARYLGYSQETVSRLKPLLDLGLVRREKAGYVSTLSEQLIEICPSLDTQELIDQLLKEGEAV